MTVRTQRGKLIDELLHLLPRHSVAAINDRKLHDIAEVVKGPVNVPAQNSIDAIARTGRPGHIEYSDPRQISENPNPPPPSRLRRLGIQSNVCSDGWPAWGDLGKCPRPGAGRGSGRVGALPAARLQGAMAGARVQVIRPRTAQCE